MKKTLFRWHSYIGLISLLPLILISVTGSLLVFKYEIDTLLRGEMVNASVASTRLPMNELITSVNQAHDPFEIVGWVLFQEKEKSDVVYLIPRGTEDWYHIYVDPYSGEFLSKPAQATDYLTDWLLEFHASFLLSEGGVAIVFVYSLLLIFLGISGLILHRKFWRNLFKLRTQARRVLYYSDLHKLVGAWGSPILLVLGITGGYWNIAHLLHEYEHYVEDDHYVMEYRHYNENLSFDELIADTQNHLEGFVATYIRFPHEEDDHIKFYGEVPDTLFVTSQYSSTVEYHRETGEFLGTYDIRQAPTLHVVIDSFRRLHFGTFGGLTSRVIWLIVGLIPVILAASGLYLWLKRRKARAAKRNKAKRKQATI